MTEGNAGASASTAASPRVPTTDEVRAVVEATFPESENGFFGVCAANPSQIGDCPITVRLRDRLLEAQVPICRCQNGSMTRELEVETHEGGAIARVTMFGGSAVNDLIMLMEDDVLLVDDQTCAGDPATSIYIDPVGPC